MKKLSFSIVFLAFSTFFISSLNAEEMKSKEIIELLEKANKVSEEKNSDNTKSLDEVIQKLRENKEKEALESEQGVYNNENLNARIKNLINFYKNKKQNYRLEVMIKDYTLLKECNQKKKCKKYAIINNQNVENAILKLKEKEDLYEKYKNNLLLANSLYRIHPFSVKKQRIEQLENDMYQTETNFNNTSSSNNVQNSTTSLFSDKETVDSNYIIEINPTSVLLRKKG